MHYFFYFLNKDNLCQETGGLLCKDRREVSSWTRVLLVAPLVVITGLEVALGSNTGAYHKGPTVFKVGLQYVCGLRWQCGAVLSAYSEYMRGKRVVMLWVYR